MKLRLFLRIIKIEHHSIYLEKTGTSCTETQTHQRSAKGAPVNAMEAKRTQGARVFAGQIYTLPRALITQPCLSVSRSLGLPCLPIATLTASGHSRFGFAC